MPCWCKAINKASSYTGHDSFSGSNGPNLNFVGLARVSPPGCGHDELTVASTRRLPQRRPGSVPELLLSWRVSLITTRLPTPGVRRGVRVEHRGRASDLKVCSGRISPSLASDKLAWVASSLRRSSSFRRAAGREHICVADRSVCVAVVIEWVTCGAVEWGSDALGCTLETTDAPSWCWSLASRALSTGLWGEESGVE